MDDVNYSEELAKDSNDTISNREIPKREHLLKWMEISVSEPEKRSVPSSVKMQDSYVVYLVETK
ncbi:hypothetical protein LSH36_485g02066 [Paralvinella palmiformis]|uniref:Uncharacterized protein n=1 Tax=Paralvinella palmiformis TaxID=53620 RepID=A0AAD9MX62_9ANNE|nr:hypothetical protein LSH36_485g02066 [Paralvinella palmiformis]